MKISRDTYEIVFIDYLEGQLSDDELKDLVDFLDKNPDLEEELKTLVAFSKQIDQIEKSPSIDTNTLKREAILDENESNFEELCIAFYEGLLSESEENYLLELTDKDENLLKTFEAYGQIQFKADESIVFPDKSKLKKRKTIHWLNYVSYAASIVIVMGVFFYLKNDNTNQVENPYPTQFAESTYMDYPKVGFEVNEPQMANNNSKLSDDIEVPAKKMLYVSPEPNTTEEVELMMIEEYDYKSRINQNSEAQLYSRKGKLAYNTPTELEMYLLDNFAKKNINEVSISDAMEESQRAASTKGYGPLSRYNDVIQLATSFKPEVSPKKILGSQPASH